MTILPNAIYRFNAIPIKLPMTFFIELEQKNSQFIWKHTKSQIAKAVLKKKNGPWKSQPSWLQIILQSYNHQDSMVLAQKNRNTDQWNKIESPEVNPCTYGHLIYDRRVKNMQWREDSVFSKWSWENWTVQFSRSVMSEPLWLHRLQHARLHYLLPTPGACSNSCPLSRWCHPTISSSVIPFSSYLQSFQPSGSFQMSQFFPSDG